MKKAFLFFVSLIVFLFLADFSTAEVRIGKKSIPEILPLKLRYKAGETLYYRLVRQNFNFKMDGTRSGEMKAVAYFIRTRLEDDSQGRVNERFTWKSFWFGQTLTSSPLKLVEFKQAENFSLLYSANDAEAINKFDFSSLPRTFDGFFFMIMTWDAVTFDGAIRPTEYLSIPDEARIGAEFSDKHGSYDLAFSYPPLVTDSKYSFSGKNWVKVLGVSLVRNIPCAIIEFANLENRVDMNILLKPMEIRTRGFEHFWGKTYLSLKDGRVVRGELFGPVAMLQDIQTQGQMKSDHSEFLVIGYLEMDLLSEEEFNSELRKVNKEK